MVDRPWSWVGSILNKGLRYRFAHPSGSKLHPKSLSQGARDFELVLVLVLVLEQLGE